MKRFMMAVALTLVLFATALAGDVPSVGYAPPPPDLATGTTTTALDESSSDGSVPSTLENELIGDVMGFLNLLAI